MVALLRRCVIFGFLNSKWGLHSERPFKYSSLSLPLYISYQMCSSFSILRSSATHWADGTIGRCRLMHSRIFRCTLFQYFIFDLIAYPCQMQQESIYGYYQYRDKPASLIHILFFMFEGAKILNFTLHHILSMTDESQFGA